MKRTLLTVIAESLKIKVSREAIELSNSSAISNLVSLSDQLKEWNIDTLAVKINKEQLLGMPYPAVAHLSTGGGHFVILQKVESGSVFYTDPIAGSISKVIDKFADDWTGALLLLETNAKSGEEDFKPKHKQEVFEQASLFLLLVLLMVLWALPFFVIPWGSMPTYLFNTIGAVISFLLLQKQFGLGGSALNSFCKMGSKSDCDTVINSPASKLLGIINLSELGLWYFAGSVLSVALASFSPVSVAPYLFVLTLLASMLSFPAIYYQGLVIKKWCPLCLAVVAVLWLETVAYFLSPPVMIFDFKSASVLFTGFALPLIFWLPVRKRFIDSFKLPALQRNLNRFLQSDRVFQKLLQDQPMMETGTFTHELQSGLPDAPIQLVVVSNPQCGPCAYTHAVLDGLKDSLSENVNIVYRFTVNTQNKYAASYQVLETLFAIQQMESNEKALTALSAWYQSNGNLEGWKKRYSQNQEESNTVNDILKEHEQWCTKVVIQKTPTLVINGRILPEEFSVSDLKFQLRKLAEKITSPELIA